MAPILVTGGTGILGRRVVRLLKADGRDVRVLTRQSGKQEAGVKYFTGDLKTGAGIDEAVAGVETIIHCAGDGKGDELMTRNLVRAAGVEHGGHPHSPARAGQPHIVNISVVGAERIPVTGRRDRMMFFYFATKLKTEGVIEGSGLPWTNLRATQFHDLMFIVASSLAKLPVVPVPSGVSFQPVETEEVAARLVELALGEPAGLVPEMAGPNVYALKDIVRSYLQATHKRRLLVPMPLPGGAARAVRAGAILSPDQAVGVRTWEAFLADRLAEPGNSAEAPAAAGGRTA